MYKKIRVASDVSNGGINVVASATDLAAKYGASLITLHVYELPSFQRELREAIYRAARNFAGRALHDDACILVARRQAS